MRRFLITLSVNYGQSHKFPSESVLLNLKVSFCSYSEYNNHNLNFDPNILLKPYTLPRIMICLKINLINNNEDVMEICFVYE